MSPKAYMTDSIALSFNVHRLNVPFGRSPVTHECQPLNKDVKYQGEI